MKLIYILFSIVFTTVFFTSASAQGKTDYSNAISIMIQGSQSEPTVGSGLGVAAEISNISDSTVSLDGATITLTLPPELLGPFTVTLAYDAFLPTEWETIEANQPSSITLQPGDTYKVFWSPGRGEYSIDSTTLFGGIIKTIKSELKFIFFTPGEYTLTVDAKYWIENQPDYHTITVSSPLRFAAPQSVILFGAALGGLIAFYIFPHSRRRLIIGDKARESTFWAIAARVGKEIAGIVGAILLSAIVTILLARISETQFLIKVSIADFWGAIAIGFVANYLGARGLEKLLPQLGSSSKPAETPAPQVEAAPEPATPPKGNKDDTGKANEEDNKI